jgi:hypothetical protein
MKTRAAELELDPPMEAAGLCHSDEHIRARGAGRLPIGAHRADHKDVHAGRN